MPNHSYAFSRAVALSPWLVAGLLLVWSGPAPATGSQAGAAAAKESGEAKLDTSAGSSALSAAAGDFKAGPNDQTWQALTKALKMLLGEAKSARVPYSQIEKANRELSDLGLKV